jgi:acetyl-CoA synthetase
MTGISLLYGFKLPFTLVSRTILNKDLQVNYKRKTPPLSQDDYQKTLGTSLSENDQFWLEQSKTLDWIQSPTKAFEGDLSTGDIRWFEDGVLNACYNCIDRHLAKHGDETALIWEDNDPAVSSTITYQELYDLVAQFANALKSKGVTKGDTVCIYMPMIPQATIAMLACARIGAVHSVVFGGFSPEAIADRIQNGNCHYVITADGGMRGDKFIPLKDNVDKALEQCPDVKTVFVTKYTGQKITMVEGRDVWEKEVTDTQSTQCPCEAMKAEDPLFILFTSGSTGKPKGVLHTTGGYLLYAATTFQAAFDYVPGQVYWCTADVGWITGHSYLVYGPLANRATSLIFSGVPNYPDASRCWQVVDKHKVTIFYTAPTAIRALMREGDDFVKKTKRDSLKVLGSVGEPINPEVWQWYSDIVGEGRCPIVDTWWQTETGGFMIFPLPGITPLIPGCATKPFFGIDVELLDEQGKEIDGEGSGILVIKKPWPGMMRSIYGDHQRFIETYLAPYPGYYLAGDAASRDKEGNYTLTGRIDDVINVSGHRIGTAELESVLVQHKDVAESAVVSFPHEIKGEALYAFVALKAGAEKNDSLNNELSNLVKEHIGSFAKPDKVQFVSDLPKTRSGKIMRRILRKIAHHEFDDLGDISTLANPDIVKEIIKTSLHNN